MPSSSDEKIIAIIGGGISGLATAHFIKRMAKTDGRSLQVDLFEKDIRPGGKFMARKEKGFTVEAGPNGFLDSKPWTLDLVRNLGMEDRLLPSDQSAAKRFIYSRGRMHELKASPLSFFTSNLLSIPGRIRIMGEFLAKSTPPGQDTSLAEFATRRLGGEALERMLDPMVSGIFAGDPSQMSLRASFPRIAELEEKYGGLTRAMLKIASDRKKAKKSGEDVSGSSGPSGPGGVLTTFKDGVSELTDQLGAELKDHLHTGVSVNSIKRENGRWCISSDTGDFIADLVILATPAYSTANILSRIAPESSSILSMIPYSPMAIMGLGYNLPDLEKTPYGFGYLIPGVEKRRILGALWTSSIFPGYRSPGDRFLIRAMIGGAKDHQTPFLPDEELAGIVKEELAVTMGLEAPADFVSIIRWEKAIPLYTVGHLDRLEEAEASLPEGIVLVGNAYRGVGINDCVREAEVAARKVVDLVIGLS